MPVSNTHYQDQRTIIYRLDEVKKTFRQYKKTDTPPNVKDYSEKDHLLPEFIRIERNNGYNTFSGLNNLLRLRDASNWAKCTVLGLRPAGTANFYYTNLLIKSGNALCIVYYELSNKEIEIRIFEEFYPCPKHDLHTRISEIITNCRK
ncbi:hypothetical protein [Chryseobacterium limigenitum]|uniref:Uncharacterized protein n=1 Tax=Chryseobacterium limigenitum TaxID=1612149 RepID=A0A1K2IUS1_9FLAO|nr:hypothetical protein [Chryseobacterium limigenitum]SFZ95483.1 hypothetical protein SAMN05216324_11051 [Chryseobacterium limigenitum]